MPADALALALTAAVIHAVWNLLIARSGETEATTVVSLLVAVTIFAPVTAATWHVTSGAWPFVFASQAIQLVYYAVLAGAHPRARFSLVYPLARGGAPVPVLAISIVALG